MKMNTKGISTTLVLAALGACLGPNPLHAQTRFYDDFATSTNWSLQNESGSASVDNYALVLTSPANVLSQPQATSLAGYNIDNSRQSILVESHTGVSGDTVFFYWATNAATGDRLETKIDDLSPTLLVAGYYIGSTYHWVASVDYPTPVPDGLYLAFQETNGTTYWQYSTNGTVWTTFGTETDPFSETDLAFEMQHKAFNDTSTATGTTVSCFNYLLNGSGYYSLQNQEETSQQTSDGWQLYTEAFDNGTLECTDCPTNVIEVDGVGASDHFTDSSIPEPRLTDEGYDDQIIQSDAYQDHWYINSYRYQWLPFVDAEFYTYHLYFKYSYPQYIMQGLEFPLNKYTGSNRLQGAVAWYPERPDNGQHIGTWSVWNGSIWTNTGYAQQFSPNWWYELTFTVGLHDNAVSYSDFSAGTVNSLTNWTWDHSYAAPSSGSSEGIVPALQIDDDTEDTTLAGTEKDCYMAEWNITWQFQKLP